MAPGTRYPRHRRTLGFLLVLLLGAGGCYTIYHRTVRFPSLEPYQRYFQNPSETDRRPGEYVKVTFLGVSTMLLSDGQTSLMVDAFLTRPGSKLAIPLTRKVAPDPEVVERVLRRLGVERLAAVLVTHTHYDHVMDAPEVARRTGAVVVGSESTAWVSRGGGLPEAQIREVCAGSTVRYGAFSVTFIESRHGPTTCAGEPNNAGVLSAPLVPPVWLTDYKEGGTYSLLIEHPLGRMLVHPSAGVLEGELQKHRADTIFLGIARLGNEDPACQAKYWAETVRATGAKRIVAIHWDHFALDLFQPLRPFPRVIADFHGAMAFLQHKLEHNPALSLHLMQGFDSFVLYERP